MKLTKRDQQILGLPHGCTKSKTKDDIKNSKILWAEYVVLHKDEYNPPPYQAWLENLVMELRIKK